MLGSDLIRRFYTNLYTAVRNASAFLRKDSVYGIIPLQDSYMLDTPYWTYPVHQGNITYTLFGNGVSSEELYTHEIDPFVSFEIPGVYAFFPEELNILMRYLDNIGLHPVPLYAVKTDEYTLGQFYRYLRDNYLAS